jgi:FG-GAP-like repeat
VIFNSDGIPDLVVAVGGTGSTPAVSVFLGKGDGTFQSPLGSGSGIDSWYIAVGDFNGDGKQDVAIGGYDNTTSQPVIQILLGNGGHIHYRTNHRGLRNSQRHRDRRL